MSQPISVIIPSYRNPEFLDLCLRSATENKVHPKTQIIVILDGYADESEHVINKYPGIDVVAFEENKGQTISHNTGVMLAEHQMVLIINDDNVCPSKYDDLLASVGSIHENIVLSPNQMEPHPSIFKSFVIENLGTTPQDFQYRKFLQNAHEYSRQYFWDRLLQKDGQTWPLFMHKRWFMALNGIDQNFPSPAVADWDFYLRCELAGLTCKRFMGCLFYHFAGAATKKTPEMAQQHGEKEQQSFEYFSYKWGYHPKMRADTHSKINIELPIVRGVEFLKDPSPEN